MPDLCPKRCCRLLITTSPSQPAATEPIISEGQHAAARPPPPALPSGSMWSLAAGDSGSSADAGNNGLIDGGAERLGARVPRPFAPRLPRTAGGPFP